MTRTTRFVAAAIILLLSPLATAQQSAEDMVAKAKAAYEREDYSEALKWLHLAADQGDAETQGALADMYRFGKGVPQDYSEAAKWYHRAAEQGHADSQWRLGMMYSDGKGVPQDYSKAAKWYRRAAEQGDAASQWRLGMMYSDGKGVPQDYSKAANWYRHAAEQGDYFSQWSLGFRFFVGDGVPQDYSEAMKWYRRAADQGDAEAQGDLADMYRLGKGVPQDYSKAAKWYRRAADQGQADAQFSLGVMYSNGHGVPQDYFEAIKWYHRAADQGQADAQFNLGVMYYDGRGFSQNYLEAMKWYRRAADQGQADAQFNLGVMYSNGQGVLQDYFEAVKWYRPAAERGYASAQNNLGVMYEHGHGVPQDYERAYLWFNLAVSRHSASESERRQRAVRNRDRVAAYLTPEALARAQRMAREWRPGTAVASASPAAGDKDLRARIAMLQERLARLGYDPGPADGVLGARTRAAIRAFQRAQGLVADGRFSRALESEVSLAALPVGGESGHAAPALEKVSTGTGFRVSTAGHILTNAHVVAGCAEVRLPPAGPIALVARDVSADLALLKGPVGETFARFRQGRGVRPGAGVVVLGYPLRGVLASGATVTTGAISALAGPGDDRRLIQISAPVQKGNSGGPVLDMAGRAVGVVVAKLDAMKFARATGDLPQNVNFAVSAGAARAFLDAEGIDYATAPSDTPRRAEEVAAEARAFTALLECWK